MSCLCISSCSLSPITTYERLARLAARLVHMIRLWCVLPDSSTRWVTSPIPSLSCVSLSVSGVSMSRFASLLQSCCSGVSREHDSAG